LQPSPPPPNTIVPVRFSTSPHPPLRRGVAQRLPHIVGMLWLLASGHLGHWQTTGRCTTVLATGAPTAPSMCTGMPSSTTIHSTKLVTKRYLTNYLLIPLNQSLSTFQEFYEVIYHVGIQSPLRFHGEIWSNFELGKLLHPVQNRSFSNIRQLSKTITSESLVT
jgi:hypothetical protein